MTDALGNTLTNIYDTEGNLTREELRDPPPSNSLRRFVNYYYDDNGRRRFIAYDDVIPNEADDPDARPSTPQ